GPPSGNSPPPHERPGRKRASATSAKALAETREGTVGSNRLNATARPVSVPECAPAPPVAAPGAAPGAADCGRLPGRRRSPDREDGSPHRRGTRWRSTAFPRNTSGDRATAGTTGGDTRNGSGDNPTTRASSSTTKAETIDASA